MLAEFLNPGGGAYANATIDMPAAAGLKRDWCRMNLSRDCLQTADRLILDVDMSVSACLSFPLQVPVCLNCYGKLHRGVQAVNAFLHAAQGELWERDRLVAEKAAKVAARSQEREAKAQRKSLEAASALKERAEAVARQLVPLFANDLDYHLRKHEVVQAVAHLAGAPENVAKDAVQTVALIRWRNYRPVRTNGEGAIINGTAE